MADTTTPARFIVHPDGLIEDRRAPEPKRWNRKHGSEPPAEVKKPSPNGVLVKVLLGAFVSIVLAVVGFERSLERGPASDDSPSGRNHPLGNATTIQSLQQMGDRYRASAILIECDTEISVFESATEMVRAQLDCRNAEMTHEQYVEILAEACGTLDVLEKLLTPLLQTRLTIDQTAAVRLQLERIERARITLISFAPRP